MRIRRDLLKPDTNIPTVEYAYLSGLLIFRVCFVKKFLLCCDLFIASIEHLLCGRHCFRGFLHMNPFSPHHFTKQVCEEIVRRELSELKYVFRGLSTGEARIVTAPRWVTGCLFHSGDKT